MEWRSALNGKPVITVILIVLLAAIAVTFFVRHAKLTPSGKGKLLGVYYTPDEGATLEADSFAVFPPYERDGKTFVRAYRYSCDDKKTFFIGYLEKLKPEVQAEINGMTEDKDKYTHLSGLDAAAYLVKKPNEGDWVPKDSGQGRNISVVLCPNTGEPAIPDFPDVTDKVKR